MCNSSSSEASYQGRAARGIDTACWAPEDRCRVWKRRHGRMRGVDLVSSWCLEMSGLGLGPRSARRPPGRWLFSDSESLAHPATGSDSQATLDADTDRHRRRHRRGRASPRASILDRKDCGSNCKVSRRSMLVDWLRIPAAGTRNSLASQVPRAPLDEAPRTHACLSPELPPAPPRPLPAGSR